MNCEAVSILLGRVMSLIKSSCLLKSPIILALAMATLALSTNWAHAQFREQATIDESITVLNEIMQIPVSAIPTKMLADAQAVAIIPRVIKGSFVVGARHGNGVIIVRDEQGQWRAPLFLTLTGGNVGWQVGIQSTDVILVFKTRTSVESMLSGKFTIGADAAAAAGPVGRNASAATDGRLQAEVYSYSRSRGLFAGISIDGSVLKLNQFANASYYRPVAPGQPAPVPPAAAQLVHTLMTYTGELQPAPVGQPQPEAAPGQPPLAQRQAQDEASAVRDELARFAPQLFRLLDKSWQAYLALPAEIFSGNAHPAPTALADCLNRYEQVRSDARYQTLIDRPEFQSTYGLLKHYQQALTQAARPLTLPDPPK